MDEFSIRNYRILNETISLNAIIFMTLGYFSMVCGLSSHMVNREKPYNLKKYVMVYNIIQIITNIYMINGMYGILYHNFFGINWKFSNKTEYYVYIHYLSKYLDFIDTVFIILRGKSKEQLSFLHLYHHSTIPIVWWYLLYTNYGNGTASFGALINSMVHLVMYSHYLYTSFGYKNPFKRWITRIQLGQFFLLLVHFWFAYTYDNNFPPYITSIELYYQLSMVILFSNFYNKEYLTIKKE